MPTVELKTERPGVAHLTVAGVNLSNIASAVTISCTADDDLLGVVTVTIPIDRYEGHDALRVLLADPKVIIQPAPEEA